MVNVLRHGIRVASGAQFRLCYFRPATEKNPDAWERYRANRFDYLDAKTAEIDALIEAKQSMADKLREYRRSLISEAVTGKFKALGV